MGDMTLAVKYRPRTFEEVSEQDDIKIILQNQIKTGNLKHAYLFCGGAGTGKTTTARLIANMINEGKGSPIEIDCASHNGVEDMRGIQEECSTRPLVGKYKIFLMDECVPGDTEILTDKGYKQFKDLDKTEKIAQYNDDGTIEFVKPIRYIKHKYRGDMYRLYVRDNRSVLMTPNHVQPVKLNASGVIKESYIKECCFSNINSVIVSGEGIGIDNEDISDLDRLVIASQADGYMRKNTDRCGYNKWYIRLSKQSKIDRILYLFDSCNIHYKQIKLEEGVVQYSYDLPENITKNLTDYFDINISSKRAKQILDEIVMWNGFKQVEHNTIGYYSTTLKSNADFVSALATLSGFEAGQTCIKCNTGEQDILYEVNWRDITTISGKDCYTELEYYGGDVYCVEVPSHKIIIRAQGFTFITGNCHMITQQRLE